MLLAVELTEIHAGVVGLGAHRPVLRDQVADPDHLRDLHVAALVFRDRVVRLLPGGHRHVGRVERQLRIGVRIARRDELAEDRRLVVSLLPVENVSEQMPAVINLVDLRLVVRESQPQPQKAGGFVPVLVQLSRKFCDFVNGLAFASGRREGAPADMVLLDKLAAGAEGEADVGRFAGNSSQFGIEPRDHDLRGVLVLAGVLEHFMGIDERLFEVVQAIRVGDFTASRQSLQRAGPLPADAEADERALERSVPCQPFARLVDGQLVVLPLVVIEADEAELEHLALKAVHCRRAAGMLEELVVDAERLPEILLLFKALALPHAGEEAAGLAAVLLVHELEFGRGLGEDGLVFARSRGPRLSLFIGAEGEIELRLDVVHLGDASLDEQFRILLLVDEGRAFLPRRTMLLVSLFKGRAGRGHEVASLLLKLLPPLGVGGQPGLDDLHPRPVDQDLSVAGEGPPGQRVIGAGLRGFVEHFRSPVELPGLGLRVPGKTRPPDESLRLLEVDPLPEIVRRLRIALDLFKIRHRLVEKLPLAQAVDERLIRLGGRCGARAPHRDHRHHQRHEASTICATHGMGS